MVDRAGQRTCGGRDPRHRHHAGQGPSGGVGGASHDGQRPGRTASTCWLCRCTAIATTTRSCPGRRLASWSSPRACRRWRPGCKVALPGAPRANPSTATAGRPMKSFNLTEWALKHRAVVLFLIIVIMIGGVLGFTQARPARGPEVLRAVDDRDGDLAGRDRAADAGRSAQPHGEEVRAARPLRQGRHLRAPGLWRHDDHREGRHVARGPARSLVPGAQEVQRHQARAARRRRSARSSTTSTATSTGLLYAVKGDGIGQWELSDIAEDIKRRLLKVPMVKKVDIYGKQDRRSTSSSRTSAWPRSASRRSQIAESLQSQNAMLPERLRSTPARTA